MEARSCDPIDPPLTRHPPRGCKPGEGRAIWCEQPTLTLTSLLMEARGASPASHRDERCARRTRRAEREYRLYLTEAQRGPPGCSARRVQRELHHRLLEPDHLADAFDLARQALAGVRPALVRV